jgi:hypothetical protein
MFYDIPTMIMLGAIGIITCIILSSSLYVIRQAEAIIVERLGKYNRTLGPGLHVIIPFFESPRKIYWTYTIEQATRGPRAEYGEDGKQYTRYTLSTYRIDLREAVYDFPTIAYSTQKMQSTKYLICQRRSKNLHKQPCVILLVLSI